MEHAWLSYQCVYPSEINSFLLPSACREGGFFIDSMKKVLFFLCFSCLLFGCKKQEKDAAEIVGKTAKIYYDYLLHDDYAAFVDGSFRPDSIPSSYREQLIDNAKMFIAQQQTEHQGIKEVRVIRHRADTAKHTADVFLLLTFGDSTSEQIVVPMIQHKGTWLMR